MLPKFGLSSPGTYSPLGVKTSVLHKIKVSNVMLKN
jgi:hypothetical protein